MSYPYFFISKNAVKGGSIFIVDEDHRHLIKVLRAKIGDSIGISDNQSIRYETVLEKIDRISATLKILDSKPIKRRIPEIHLYLCALKKDAMEMAIQKNTEIGVDVIIPVLSSRVIVEITGNKKENRLLRWKQIAYNASKQSRRSFICSVSDFTKLENINPGEYDVFFLPYEGTVDGRQTGSLTGIMDYFEGEKIKKMQKIAFIIGPEGGFESDEVSRLINQGANTISFGRNILRAETASMYLASIIDFLLKISNG